MQKTLLMWVFLVGLCALTAAGAYAQASDPGRIVLARVAGEVSLLEKATQATTKANNGKEIGQGFVVSTGKGGSVVLVFSNGATINLKEDSVLDIEKYLQDPLAENFNPATATDEPTVSNTKLNLTRGELVGNVKHLKKDKGSSFDVQTPVGAAGIRGTTFRIVYRPNGNGTAFFSLTTTEGNVLLSTGTVNLPVGTSPTDLTPKEVVINATVDATTGAVTITTPTSTLAVVVAPTTSTASVATAVAESIQAVTAVVFTPATATDPAADKAAADKAAADKKAADEKAAADKAAADKAAADKAAADKAAADKAAADKASPSAVVAPPALTAGAGGGE